LEEYFLDKEIERVVYFGEAEEWEKDLILDAIKLFKDDVQPTDDDY